MSNPFKIKKLDDFTINDCESYLSQYPYGEHHIEVKKRLIGLKVGRIKQPESAVGKQKKPKQTANNAKPEQPRQPSTTYQPQPKTTTGVQQGVKTSDSEDIGDTILAWVGLIVIVIIVGSVIIYAIDALLPKDVVAFIGKYKYGIYAICLAIGRWIEAAGKTWK